jgi:hypothetical protein
MSSLSIDINRLSGYTKATKFKVSVNYANLTDLLKIKWSFGDGGIIYDKNYVEYNYMIPGQYDIWLFGYTNTDILTAKQTVRAENYVKDSIFFKTIPPPAFAGHYNRYPFRIHITTATVKDNIVDLYAQYSRSYQYQDPQNKWSFLKPQWRFLDLDGNQIWNIKTTDTELKITEDGEVDQIYGTTVGVSGYADFYFVDDIYNSDLVFDGSDYTTLWASLQTSGRRVSNDSFNADLSLPGFSNTTSKAYAPYMVNKRLPEKILITENGVRPHSNPRWTGAIQPVIMKAGFDESYDDDWKDGNSVLVYEPPFSFAKYFPLDAPDIYFNSGVINLSTNFIQTPVFKWIDDTGYKVAGYYKGSFYVDPSTPYAFSTNITAALCMNAGDTTLDYFNPHIWLPNPEAGTVSVAQYYKNNNLTFEQIANDNLRVAQVKTFDMPVIDEVDFVKDPMALSGIHGIYSVAALPAPNYHAWLCDSEMNMIYRVTTTGTILCSIDINKIIKNKNLGYSIEGVPSPSHISLDGNKNIWVTLHDTLSVLKFDPIGNFLLATTPLNLKENAPTNTAYNWFVENSYYPTNINNYDQRLIEPTGIDTDKDNNIWVTYSNYLSGFVIKYNSNGNLLTTINSPVCSTPQEIITDNVGNVWICNAGNIWGTKGSIQKRTSNGVLLSTFGGINNPNYLALDISQNIWFSYDFNKIGFIENINGTTLTYTISAKTLCDSNLPYADYPKSNISFSNKYPSNTPWFDDNLNSDETAIEGIACDMRGYLYIINSIENSVYVFDTNKKVLMDYFIINPQGYLFYQEDQLSPTKMDYYKWNKSLQATGDWTGLRWTNKFGNGYLKNYSTNLTFCISGISESLNFYDRSVYTAFKINEDFDLAQNMKQFAHMPILQKSEFLFDNLLSNIFGKKPFYQDDLACVAYEKIANYVGNNTDPDTCEIPQLYNLAQMVNSESEDLQFSYPPTIKRIMNLASVNISKLIGTDCKCGLSFERHNDCAKVDVCPYCKKEKQNNRGDLINSTTTPLTAGVQLVLKSKSINNYKLISSGEVDSSLQYTLNDLATSMGLGNNWTDYYEFYEYVPHWNGGIVENLIDWESDQTTINRNLSTVDDWYKDEGLLDIFFNYELYKGLGLLND